MSFTDWRETEFDHNTHSRFALEGAHARARTLLEAAMSSRALTARGPLRWAPYLYLDEKIPGPDDLEKLEVRFEWPVR